MNEHAAFILGLACGFWLAGAIHAAVYREWARLYGNLGLSLFFFATHLCVFR